ncbi:MAG: TauD/TfdA family dioxygenase [Minicystis sp.]
MSWAWSEVPPAERSARIRSEIAARGLTLIRADVPELSPAEAARAPWDYAARLLGERPRMVERQPIKAVPGGRSFASSAGPAPLHTDSQLHAGAPPSLQVMACVRPADRGGEHVLVDGWALLDRIRAGDPDLYRALFEIPRRIPFVFGDVFGPTVALRGGFLALTHAPFLPPDDAIAARLAPWIEASPRIELTTAAGEILVADNHRMLHGRRGFDGGAREYVRLLVWSSNEIATHPEHRAYAARVAASVSTQLAGAPEAVRRRLGLTLPPPAERRLAIVLEMLRGVPPGVLAVREQIPEPELYRMRDAAIAAAEGALGAGPLPGSDDEMARLLLRR